MLGLGETQEEVAQAMDDCLNANVDFFTIGQYLQPSPKHFKLHECFNASVWCLPSHGNGKRVQIRCQLATS